MLSEQFLMYGLCFNRTDQSAIFSFRTGCFVFGVERRCTKTNCYCR